MKQKSQIRDPGILPGTPARKPASASALSEAELDRVSGGGGARGGIIEKTGS
jgi:hypothetical protein